MELDGVVVADRRLDAALRPSGLAADFSLVTDGTAHTLLVGDFHLAVCLWNQGAVFDLQEPALSFAVEAGPSPLYRGFERKGVVHVDCPWSIDDACEVETPRRVAGGRG